MKKKLLFQFLLLLPVYLYCAGKKDDIQRLDIDIDERIVSVCITQPRSKIRKPKVEKRKAKPHNLRTSDNAKKQKSSKKRKQQEQKNSHRKKLKHSY